MIIQMSDNVKQHLLSSMPIVSGYTLWEVSINDSAYLIEASCTGYTVQFYIVEQSEHGQPTIQNLGRIARAGIDYETQIEAMNKTDCKEHASFTEALVYLVENTIHAWKGTQLEAKNQIKPSHS